MRLKKSVHQRMLVEQDLQLCSTLVSGVLASSYTATHSVLQFTPLECTMTLYNIATHPFNAHHPMRHSFFCHAPNFAAKQLISADYGSAIQWSEIQWCGSKAKCRVASHQAGTTCGASSQADLTQNLVLKTRMLRFLRHSRQKCRKLSFLRQKRAVFSIKHQYSLTSQ